MTQVIKNAIIELKKGSSIQAAGWGGGYNIVMNGTHTLSFHFDDFCTDLFGEE